MQTTPWVRSVVQLRRYTLRIIYMCDTCMLNLYENIYVHTTYLLGTFQSATNGVPIWDEWRLEDVEPRKLLMPRDLM